MIINRHGGRVWAENRSTGPVYSFVLPGLNNKRG
jgi:hypothetical protein